MKRKHPILALAAAAAVLLATGCGKQETPATPSGENTTKHPASVANEEQQAVPAPRAAEPQAAAPAQPEPAPAPGAVAATPATTPLSVTALPVSPAVVTQAQTAAMQQPVVNPPAATAGSLAGTPASALQTQPLSLGQTLTNQFQALAAAATNRVLSALAITNQAATLTTNQVQALLEKAKNLSANQKYQEALATLTELYNTKLTPEQKQKADELKAQVQTALSQKATSTLESFLGGKKQ